MKLQLTIGLQWPAPRRPDDMVNAAAHLQGAATAREILVTEESYSFVEPQFPGAPRRELELKGKSGTVVARLIASSSR